MFRAIVFDFYDTLVYRDEAVTAQVRQEIAGLLEVPVTDLNALWRRYRDERMLGVIASLEEHLSIMARDLSRRPSPEILAEAARIEREGQRRAVHPYPDAIPTLVELRKMGFRLGLLSNTSDAAEEPIKALGFGSYFDSLVLSHVVGILKPDPRIYAVICQQLQTHPVECAFVADGGFGELDAAHKVGMLAVKIEQDHQSKDYGSSDHCDVCLSDIRDLLPLARGWLAMRKTGG